MRGEVPQLQLFFNTTANGFARHNAAEHVGGLGQISPVFVSQAIDVF